MKYDLILAVDIARLVEDIVKPFDFHCALGGSCLYSGESDKDVDIFIYPRSSDHPLSTYVIEELISKQGFIPINKDFSAEIKDWTMVPDVLPTIWSGVRVDFFFLERAEVTINPFPNGHRDHEEKNGDNLLR